MSDQDVPVAEEEGAVEVPEGADEAAPDDDAATPELPGDDVDGPADDDAAGDDDSPDGGEGEESGDEGAPEPSSPDTEARLDQITSGLTRAAKNYSKRVTDVLAGDPMGLVPCPLCSEHFPGILTPAPPSEAAIAAVRPLIGLPDFSNYRPDAHARRCDQCDGKGKTLTGSTVPQYATIQCSACKGTGFRSSLAEHVSPALPNGRSLPPPPTHVDDAPAPAMSEASLQALEEMVAQGRAALAGLATG